MDRYLSNFIIKDFTRKMVFIGDPRQVGKTTLNACYIFVNASHAPMVRQGGCLQATTASAELTLAQSLTFETVHTHAAPSYFGHADES